MNLVAAQPNNRFAPSVGGQIAGEQSVPFPDDATEPRPINAWRVGSPSTPRQNRCGAALKSWFSTYGTMTKPVLWGDLFTILAGIAAIAFVICASLLIIDWFFPDVAQQIRAITIGIRA